MTMPELLAEGLRRGALRREGKLDLGEGFASRPEFRAPVRHLDLSHTGPCSSSFGGGGGGGGGGAGGGGGSKKRETAGSSPPPPLLPLPSSPLALLLAETPRLASLDLSGTGFGDADAPALALCAGTLRSLAANGSGCGAGIQRALNFSSSSSFSSSTSAADSSSFSFDDGSSSTDSSSNSRYERAGVGSLSDAGLAALAAAAPGLERLSLGSGGCRGVGPEGLRAALSRLPQLTHVDLSGAVMSAGEVVALRKGEKGSRS